MRKPIVRKGRCRMCKGWFRQTGRGNPRMFCDAACRARFYYRQDPAKQRARIRARYWADPEKFKESRRNYYHDVQKKLHVHRDRTVTWKVVELPAPPAFILPSFSGNWEDPYGMLADYELRHLLADFENEEGELCLEAKQDIRRQTQRDLPRSRPHHIPMNLDGLGGLPSYSDSGSELQFRGHSECWPDAPRAE